MDINFQARLCKILLVFSVAIFVSLVAFNNITDYYSNFEYVKHVLSMDTTFSDNKGMWRRIESTELHHVAYIFIIALECIIALLCLVGTFKLWKSRNDAILFSKSKVFANWGLTAGVLLWFMAFISVGGEWFLMWQSEIWNGQEESAMFTTIILLILIYLNQAESN